MNALGTMIAVIFGIYTVFVCVNFYRVVTTDEPFLWTLATVMIAMNIFIGVMAYLVNKERIMTLGIFERIRERRRMAMAAAVAEKYRGIDLLETSEARQIPVAEYRCGNDTCYGRDKAEDMYWIDTQPLSPGWYCLRCTDAMRDMDKSDRLNMEVFLMVLDYETGQIDKK